MGGGGGASATETTVRYPDYMEEAHENYINSVQDLIEEGVMGDSPYAAYNPVLIDEGYFGIIEGDYPNTWAPLNFPSLWDMYGKFIGDNNVHVLWQQIYEDVLHGPEIQNSVSAHAANLEATIDSEVLPRYLAGMRDINAIQSSSFIIGKAIIQEGMIRQVNEFAAKIRLSALQLSGELWKNHLKWSHDAIVLYNDMMKNYYVVRMELDEKELGYADQDAQWDLNLWDHMRAALGAMGGGAAASGGAKPSKAQSALSGALGGASAGFAVAGPYGAAAGAVIGAGLSFL